MARTLAFTAAMMWVVLAVPAVGAQTPVQGPVSVEDVVRIALERNLGYLKAQAAVDGSRGARLDALAGLLPGASGQVSYSKSDQTSTFTVTQIDGEPINLPDLPQNAKSTSTAAGVSLSEALSLPLWYSYRGALSALEAARFGREAAKQDLAFQVRRQFYLVLRAADLLLVQEEDLQLARDQERRIQSMFELGSVARVDVLKAQVRVAEAEVTLIRQSNQVDIERSRLATLIGLPAHTPLRLEGRLEPTVAEVDSARAADEALARPDLLQAEAALGSAVNQYRSAATTKLPSLFATFDYTTSSGTSDRDQLQQAATDSIYRFSIKGDSEFDGWNFRVGARLNLDAFANMGTQRQALAGKRQAEYDLAAARLTAEQELGEAVLNLRASLLGIEAADRGVAAAEEDLRLSRERYEQGLGTVLELLESQVGLTRARNTRVNALTELKISEAALARARGAAIAE